MPELVVLNGIAAGTVFALGDVPAVVGRSPEAHLQVADPWISGMHAMFERREDGDEGVWVVDLESRNGVFLAGERVVEARLADGAIVRLGRTDIRFSLRHTTTAELAPAPTTPPPAHKRDTARTDDAAAAHVPLAREPEAAHCALAARTATVLRMAIDSTADVAPLAPERISAALDAAAAAALEHGAAVARLAGVGVLAIFGLGGATLEDAECALRAARLARAAVRASGALDLRAAIESGPVLAGNAGGAAGHELTALGSAAERAERLLASAARGEIVAGPNAGPAAALRRAGFVHLAGAEVELFRDT